MCVREQRTLPSPMDYGWVGRHGESCLFPQGTSHLLPFVCLSFPLHRLPFASPTGLDSGSKIEAQLSTESHNPEAHGLPGGPHFLPPSLLSLQQQLWRCLLKTQRLVLAG